MAEPMINRAVLEEREKNYLAPYAMHSHQSRGRAHPEEEHPYRTAYQRDRDRIIHTTAFRRLEYKTQVFVYSEGDHYRNRLTHSIEVAQIGRTLARGLGCNEELTEAICLSHDLGHPPFGHKGEETLNDLMREHGGYDHQRQTYRIVTELEQRYPDYPGLNLTYEVLEGVVKHDPDFDPTDAADYEPTQRGTLESQLGNLADEIAYNTSDLDDGLRSGLLTPSDVLQLEIAQQVLASLGTSFGGTSFGGVTLDLHEDLQRHRFIRRLVGIEVNDVLTTTSQLIQHAAVQSVTDVRKQPSNLACYSEALQQANQQLRRYLYDHFYRHYRVVRMSVKADRVVRDLFNAYIAEPQQLPSETQHKHPQSLSLQRVICDYIAGMTDRYAIQEHKRLFDPEERA